jgi:hypothetical protein
VSEVTGASRRQGVDVETTYASGLGIEQRKGTPRARRSGKQHHTGLTKLATVFSSGEHAPARRRCS